MFSWLPTFLQANILWALPLVALPILIHLINQHRHRTMHWGAMMFCASGEANDEGHGQAQALPHSADANAGDCRF